MRTNTRKKDAWGEEKGKQKKKKWAETKKASLTLQKAEYRDTARG